MKNKIHSFKTRIQVWLINLNFISILISKYNIKEAVLSDVQLKYYNRNTNNERRNRLLIENSFVANKQDHLSVISDSFHLRAIQIDCSEY
jgi:uncharacterized protein YabE (DUF348 family)